MSVKFNNRIASGHAEEQRSDTYTFILFLFYFLFCVKVPYNVEKKLNF